MLRDRTGEVVNGGESGAVGLVSFDSQLWYSGKKELRQNLARHKKQCSVKPSEQATEGSSTGA